MEWLKAAKYRAYKPGLHRPTPGSGRLRFWFDPKAVSGWERNGENLFDFLLSLSPEFPPVLEVVSAKTLLDNKGGAKVVEVLVPEHRLAHGCESCRSWETVSNNHARWILVRQDTLPGYIYRVVCLSILKLFSHVDPNGQCRQNDWFGLQILRVISSYLHMIF